MKKTALVLTGVLCLLVAAAFWLLTTGAGLRWTVGQVLARTGAPVEVSVIEGRLLGPVSLADVKYAGAGNGIVARVENVRFDWKPWALLSGVLHVTRVDASGVSYVKEASSPSEEDERGPPELAIPVYIRLDALNVESVSIGAGDPVVIDSVSFRGTADSELLAVDDLRVEAPDYRVADGRIRLGLARELSLDGALNWVVERKGYSTFEGGLTVGGGLATSLTPVVEVRAPFAASGEGTVNDVFSEPSWTLTANVPEGVSLETINAGWPAVFVSGAVISRGTTSRADLSPELSLSFQDMAALLTGEGSVSSQGLEVARARLEGSGGTSEVIDFSGRLGFADELPFQVEGAWQALQGPEGAAWASREGSFQAEGRRNRLTASLSGVVSPPGPGGEAPVSLQLEVNGLDTAPEVIGTARLPYFAYGSVAAESLNADIDFKSAEGASSSISVTVSTIRYGDRQAVDVDFRSSGTTSRHRASLTARFDDWPVEAAATGSYSENRWQGQVHELTVTPGPEQPPWRIAKPAEIVWTPSRTEIERICLTREATSACGRGHFAGDAGWEIVAQVASLPLSWWTTAAPESLEVEGTVSANARLTDTGSGIEGEAEAVIDRARVAWTADEPIETRYRNVRLRAQLNPKALGVTLTGQVDESGVLNGDLTLEDPFADNGRVHGNVSASLPSLRVLQAAAPALGLRKGTARLELEVAGTRNAPRFGGEAQIEQATLEISALGVEFSDLNLDVRGGDDYRLELGARAKAGEGDLSADGFFVWPPDGNWRGEFAIRGNQTELLRLPEALVDGNPDLTVSLDQAGGTVNGRIQITHAELTPEAARPSITISDDIVVLDGESLEQGTRNPLAWHANVSIELGDNVRFRGYGVKGRLVGALALDAPPRQPARATGSVEIRDGTYEFYGRKFDIQRGRLVYAGGPIDNPGVDVQIGREAGEVSVSMTATGPLTDPDLKLTSTPAMSDTDRMSYLLLGRAASEASGAEAGLLLRAAASLLPRGSRDVPGYIQSTLGLDTLEIQADSPDNEGGAVVLGKYLSPKLYVSYVAGFQQAVDVFRVRYDLARHWLLRAESSSRESSGDLLLTW